MVSVLSRASSHTAEHRTDLGHVFCSHLMVIFLLLGAISSGFRLEESPFVPYDFMNSSTSPASPPGSVGDGWPRAKSPNGSSSVNWPPGKMPAASVMAG